MPQTIRHYLETHFGTVLIAAFLIGLVVPGLEKVPVGFIPALLAFVIYFSSSKTEAGDFSEIRYGNALAFVALRFLVLPFLVYGATIVVLPSFAVPMLLLALMPAGASSVALVAIMDANVGLALAITVLSGFMAPLAIPLAFWLIGTNGITLDLQALFLSLIEIVILPMLVYYFGARRVPRLAAWSKANATLFSTMLMGSCMVLVVGQRRAAMFADPVYMLKATIVCSVAFALFYAVGWWFPSGKDRRARIAKTVTSGIMNNALGISVAVMYFPPEIGLFMVITEIPWTLGFTLFRRYTRRSAPPVI